MITLTNKEKEFIKTKLKPYLQKNDLKSVVQLCLGFSDVRGGYNVAAFLVENGVPILKAIDSIPKELFAHSDLEKIHIHSNIKSIGDRAFAFSKLRRITFDDGVESLGREAFVEVENLKTIKLPNSLKRIEKNCFLRNNLDEIYLPDSITVLQQGIFDGGNADIVVYANSRKNLPSSQKLKCPESEIEWYKQHLKLNPMSGGSDE